MKQEILIPSYYNEFKCIGSACEDTCCAGWKVSVDKESFNKYRKIISGPLAADLKKNISRERKTPSEMAYGKIKMDSTGRCTLLSEEGLCRIHSELGEEYLCTTCAEYPRIIHSIDMRIEKSLTISCPEAARLALLNPNGIDFIIEEEELTKNYLTRSVTPYFWDIRMFAIELLQTRTSAIEHRLIVLGLFLEKVQTTDNQALQQELPELFTRYKNMLNSPDQLALLLDLPDNILFQIVLARRLIGGRITKGLSNQRYVDCLNDVVKGLQLEGHHSVESSIAQYSHSLTQYYKPFMQEHDYILENYLVYYLFKNTFPQNLENIFKEFTHLIIQFLLIKIHLIGMASTHQELSTESIIKCIQSFSKIFEHNKEFLDEVMQDLEEKGYVSMAHMTILIKS